MNSTVEVVYALPDRQTVVEVSCTLPATIASIIQQSGILNIHPEIQLEDNRVGIHGQYQLLDHLVQQGDRVEIYRPLQMTPTEARLLRAKSRSR